MHGEFTWVDLSTFDLPTAKAFYRNVFRWDFSEEPSGSLNCSVSGIPCASIYEMPEFFQKIKMPSFWMTYIAVEDIDVTVTKAQQLGGKIELEETNARGKVALIRDPAGAGFTCYQGTDKSGFALNPKHGQWCWSELFVSNFSKVETFYGELFGWSFVTDTDTPDRYAIYSNHGSRIGAVQVASNDVKGEKEFWGVFFKVNDASKALAEVSDAGGQVIYDYSNTDGRHYLARDSQGAAFFLTSSDRLDSKSKNDSEELTATSRLKWRSFIGLAVVYLAILFEMDWLWGVLFLFWVIPDLKTGTTYFIEPLSRDENPVLYWLVVLTWIILSVYLLTGTI